jgi:hypothetical protein
MTVTLLWVTLLLVAVAGCVANRRADRHLTCPACRHLRHNTECVVVLPWWRRWLGGLDTCRCTYWDARWE